MSSRGTAERLESLSSIACRLRIAFISAGAPVDTLACSAASSPRTWATAASALSASSPSASMTTRLPLPAASIMTPMMLFAFTRRPLRDSHTSAAKFPASCVSFAAARACSPSLLTISTSILGIAGVRIQVDHAVPPAAHRLVDHRGKRFIAIGERADQHGKARPRQALDLAGPEQARGDVRWRGAQDIGEHQHPVAAVELHHQLLGL